MDWAQIYLINSLWDSSGLNKFWSCSAEFLLFPGLWSSICTSADKLLIGLSSNLVGELIRGLARSDYLLVMLCCFLTPRCLSSFHASADKLLIRLSSHWVGNIIMGFPGPFVYAHWITPFPGLCGWGLGAFLRCWLTSTMWAARAGPLIYLWPPGMSE